MLGFSETGALVAIILLQKEKAAFSEVRGLALKHKRKEFGGCGSEVGVSVWIKLNFLGFGDLSSI